MGITRFSKLKGFDNVIVGRDLENIFKDGHVYSVTEIAGEFIIRDLGEHADGDMVGYDIKTILTKGRYLFTKEEHKRKTELEIK